MEGLCPVKHAWSSLLPCLHSSWWALIYSTLRTAVCFISQAGLYSLPHCTLHGKQFLNLKLVFSFSPAHRKAEHLSFLQYISILWLHLRMTSKRIANQAEDENQCDYISCFLKKTRTKKITYLVFNCIYFKNRYWGERMRLCVCSYCLKVKQS